MYSVRILTEEDYSLLCRWWKFWRFPAPTQEMLPNNGTCGVMISKDGVDICAGFLYFTNSAMCWLEYVVSNPEVRENRDELIQQTIYELTMMAKAKGCKVVFTSIKHPRLIKHYEAVGYVQGSKGTVEMVIGI